MSPTFMVVGGGLAGAKTVEALRTQGFTGTLVLICEENVPPYERPPLSKDYLAGNTAWDECVVHPMEWYRDYDVEVRLGVRANSVNPGGHEVRLADGTALGYDKLVLATGSRPRKLPIPGAEANGVHYLRRVGDCDAIRSALDTAGQLVVIGGGWIGLETAAVARDRGLEVTLIETAELPLLGTLGPKLAPVFAELHREHGVDVRSPEQVAEITAPNGAVTGVRLRDGTEIPAQAVLVAVGARPDVELAESAGLDVDNGVLVGPSLTSSDPDVLAVGDIANAMHPRLGRRVRVEHWATALNQPTVAAATMLGTETAYTELPFFFTDQYDLGMEYVGYVPSETRHRTVLRGDLGSREFIAFWLDEHDRVLAGMNVNIWDVNETIATLIRSGNPVAPERLTDPAVPLAELAR